MVHSQDSFYMPISVVICILWYDTSFLYCLFPHIVGNLRFVFPFSFLRSMCVPSWSSSYSFVYSLSVHSHREEIKPKQPKHQDNDVMPVLPCFSITMVSEKHIWRLEFQQKLQIGNQQIKKKKKKKKKRGGGWGEESKKWKIYWSLVESLNEQMQTNCCATPKLYLPGNWNGELVGSWVGNEVFSGLVYSGSAGRSLGTSVVWRGTRTGGRTKKTKAVK